MSNNDAENFSKQLKQVSVTTKSIECFFTLQKVMTLTSAPVISEGKFYYSAPDKARWEETAPQHYVMVISGGNIQTSNSEKYKNIKHLQGVKDLMLGAANGDMIESELFEKSFYKKNDGTLVKLIPAGGRLKKLFSEIELSFDEKDLRLQSIRLNETGGDYTLITFTYAKFDRELKEELFKMESAGVK